MRLREVISELRESKKGLEGKVRTKIEKIAEPLCKTKFGYPIIGTFVEGATQEELAIEHGLNKWTYNVYGLIFWNGGIDTLLITADYTTRNVLGVEIPGSQEFAYGWVVKSIISNMIRGYWMMKSNIPKGELVLEFGYRGIFDGIAGLKYLSKKLKKRSEKVAGYAGHKTK